MPADVAPLSDLSTLTATGVLGWYAWHTAYHTIPQLVQTFRDEMAASRAECAAERELLHQELSTERAQRHEQHAAIVETLREMLGRLPAAK